MYLSAVGQVPLLLSSSRNWLGPWPVGEHNDGNPEDEIQNWSSLIGIITAICGNVLIALALNVQRYAHTRLHRQRAQIKERARQALRKASRSRGLEGAYGAAGPSSTGANGNTAGYASRRRSGSVSESAETEPLTASFQSGDSGWTEGSDDHDLKVTSTYLKDPYWWLGQVLITVGEMGNFLAYGFAPASIVSPLGVVALVSNCVIAPIFFNEVFRPQDFWGVIIAIGGAVTVVLSAKQEETKLGPHEVWDAITTIEFEIYMGVSCGLIVLLMWLSPRYGNRTILIDLGLVGLFGGYTALSTKGVSSMLSSTLFGAFATPVTYVLLFVLLSTAVMQVRYLNKALARFDSTQVIPIQFVSFTLSVIIGSAVLYRDFERTSSEQAVKFVGGCLLTFFGVFLITSGRPRHDEEDETLSDAEGIEETIGLSEQGPAESQTPRQARRGSGAVSSRRSSRASHVSFKGTGNRPLAAIAGIGFPSLRAPASSPLSKSPLGGETDQDSPATTNPWKQLQRPGGSRHGASSDTVPSVVSNAVSDSETVPESPGQPQVAISNTTEPVTPASDHPGTPRGPLPGSRPHSHHFGPAVISPSPFSTAVSAVVADKLLAHMDSPTTRRVGSRRSRAGLRNSLFMPHDETSDEEEVERGVGGVAERRAVERPLFDDDDDEVPIAARERKGVRSRARSLSQTLGELFGVSKGRKGQEGSEEAEGLLRGGGGRSESPEPLG